MSGRRTLTIGANGSGKVIKIQSPGKLDFKKADEVLKKVVRENQEWLKEMAEK